MHSSAGLGRVSALSDGVFAVLLTVLVLDLQPPTVPNYGAMLELWPRWLSYAVSYAFIAIVWVNHHYLLRYAISATARLLWFNFAHLFSMSLLPVSTTWMATSDLAPQTVSFYAAVFFLVNLTYVALVWELMNANPTAEPSPVARKLMRWRSFITLGLFGAAAIVALRWPIVGLAICIVCLAVYLKPGPTS
jgi:uncharacterized membrane protein